GVEGTASCISGPNLLAGTGFDVVDGGCGTPPNSSDLAGGGTGWLTTAGNVVPGEIMELRVAARDTSDAFFDSLVMLDNWLWNLSPASPGTNCRPLSRRARRLPRPASVVERGGSHGPRRSGSKGGG